MIMNFLDRLELIERKHGVMGTLFGIALILISTVIAVVAINAILHAWFEALNIICIKFFGFRLF